VDETTGKGVEYGIILDYSRQFSIYSNHGGEFSIDTKAGDTLVLSALGYYYRKVVVTDSLLRTEGTHIFSVGPRTYELTEARIVSLGTYNEFRNNFINLHQEKTPTEELTENLTAWSDEAAKEGYERYQQNRQHDGVTLLSVPIRGPEERERIKLAKIIEQENVRDQIYRKFNPEIVKKATGLTDDNVIIEFMVFCDFTDQYLLEIDPYKLISQIVLKYDAFKIRKQVDKVRENPVNLNSDLVNPNV